MKKIKFTIPFFLVSKGGPHAIRSFIDIELIKSAGEREAEEFKKNIFSEKHENTRKLASEILNIKVSLN